MFYSEFLEEKLPKSASGSHGKLYYEGHLAGLSQETRWRLKDEGHCLAACWKRPSSMQESCMCSHGVPWGHGSCPVRIYPEAAQGLGCYWRDYTLWIAHSIYDHKSLSHPLPKPKHVCANVHGFVKTWKASALWTVCWGVRIMQSSQGPAQNSRKNLRLENGMAYFPRLK